MIKRLLDELLKKSEGIGAAVMSIDGLIISSSGNEYLPCKEQASVFKQLVSVREEIRVGEIDHFLIKEKHRLSLVYRISEQYLVILSVKPEQILGRAQFRVRTILPDLAMEL